MEHQSMKHVKDSTPESKGAGTVNEAKKTRLKYNWPNIAAAVLTGAASYWVVWMFLEKWLG